MAAKWLGSAGHGETDGVVAKRLGDPYAPGERTMVKVKRLRTADCVVGGFRYESGSRQVGSLLLGLYDEAGKLNHVGFTSTITDAERRELTERLEALKAHRDSPEKRPAGPAGGARNAAANGSRCGRNWSSKSATTTSPAIVFDMERS